MIPQQLKALYDAGVEWRPTPGVLVRPIAQEGDGRFGHTLLLDIGTGEYFIRYRSPLVGGSGTRLPKVNGVVYLAGPMRGIPKYNFPAFDAARDQLIAAGFYVFNPADMDRAIGINEDTVEFPPFFINDAMERDLVVITKSSHIALLPGWEESVGVRPEAVLSATLKHRFLLADTLGPVPASAVMAVIGYRLIASYQAERAAEGGCQSGLCGVPALTT